MDPSAKNTAVYDEALRFYRVFAAPVAFAVPAIGGVAMLLSDAGTGLGRVVFVLAAICVAFGAGATQLQKSKTRGILSIIACVLAAIIPLIFANVSLNAFSYSGEASDLSPNALWLIKISSVILMQFLWAGLAWWILPVFGGWSRGRSFLDRAFRVVCICTAVLAVLLLAFLLFSIAFNGLGRLNPAFLKDVNSSTSATSAGIGPALIGSVVLLLICAVTAIPLGVGTAILLEEYKPKNKILRSLHGFVQLNINNLAGVPSIVYGILGVTAFANMFYLFGTFTDPGVTVGQTYYLEYRDAADNPLYALLDDPSANAFPPAAAGMTLFSDTARLNPAEATVLPAEELKPLRDRIAKDVKAIGNTIKDMLYDTRETRRGPLVVDEHVAQSIATAAFENTALQADTAELTAIVAKALPAMDGKTSGQIRSDRRALTDQIEQAEFKAAGTAGLVIEGSLPQRRSSRKPWYVQLPLGKSVLAGGLTLMLVVLPIIIVASAEAIRSVPPSMRAGCLALGGTKWQSIRQVVLPAAIPGICTGSILAMSRAIGEAAPLILLGAVFISFNPLFRENGSLMDSFSAMPLQIFQWTSEPDADFKRTAAAGIIVLLVVLLTCVMLYEVFVRYVLNAGTLWANELSLWLAGFVFLCSGLYAMQQRSHIRIFLIYDVMPRFLQKTCDVISTTLIVTFAFFLVYGGYGEAFAKFGRWETFGTAFDPPIPATIKPTVLIVVSLVAIQAVVNLISDWNEEPVVHSAADDIDEDEIERLKKAVGAD